MPANLFAAIRPEGDCTAPKAPCNDVGCKVPCARQINRALYFFGDAHGIANRHYPHNQ